MKYIDILANYEREIGLIDDPVKKPVTDDSLYWLNQGVAKFMKLRFNGDFVHKTSYEQNEKRTNDLIRLVKSASCKPQKQSYNGYLKYHIEFPEDFLYTLNEDVVICDTSGNNEMFVSVFECNADSFMYRIMNKLTDFHYRRHRARPIRVKTATGCDLLTDGNYYIQKYILGYLRQPTEITLDNPFDEYQDFSDEVMFEIIKIAAQMYVENTTKSEQRYQTISNEVNTQE